MDVGGPIELRASSAASYPVSFRIEVVPEPASRAPARTLLNTHIAHTVLPAGRHWIALTPESYGVPLAAADAVGLVDQSVEFYFVADTRVLGAIPHTALPLIAVFALVAVAGMCYGPQLVSALAASAAAPVMGGHDVPLLLLFANIVLVLSLSAIASGHARQALVAAVEAANKATGEALARMDETATLREVMAAAEAVAAVFVVAVDEVRAAGEAARTAMREAAAGAAGTGGESSGMALDPGLHVFCVENMALERVAPAQHGVFCEGDSYVVVSVAESGGARVYFWVGAISTPAEISCASFSALAFSRQLQCPALREEQDSESPAFRALFWQGITLVEGDGATSSLRALPPPRATRLYRIVASGRASRLVRLPAVMNSVAHGVITLVDAGSAVYQLDGRDASMVVRAAALDFTSSLKQSERTGVALHFASADTPAECLGVLQAIGAELGAPAAAFASAEAAAVTLDDLPVVSAEASAAAYESANPTLYAISPHLQLEQLEPPYARSSLDGMRAYVLNTATDVFVWIGAEVPAELRRRAMDAVPSAAVWPPVRVVQGAETYLFRAGFDAWPARGGRREGRGSRRVANPSAPAQSRLDVRAILAGDCLTDRLPPVYGVVDDTSRSGAVSVMVFEGEDLVYSLPESHHGHFYDTSGFAVIYTYETSNSFGGSDQKFVIYFWRGARASAKLDMAYEMSLKAALAAKFADAGTAPRFLRLEQGRESAHFLSLFGDRMVVHAGRAQDHVLIPPENIVAVTADSVIVDEALLGSGEAYNAGRLVPRPAVTMYELAPMGESDEAMTALEVPATASSLNSSRAFLVRTPHANYLWLGIGVSDAEYMPAWELAMDIEAECLDAPSLTAAKEAMAKSTSHAQLDASVDSSTSDSCASLYDSDGSGDVNENGSDERRPESPSGRPRLGALRKSNLSARELFSPRARTGPNGEIMLEASSLLTNSVASLASVASRVSSTGHSEAGASEAEAEAEESSAEASSATPSSLSKSLSIVEEGDEPDALWRALGGQQQYAREGSLADPRASPRLFVGTWARGAFAVAERCPVLVPSDLDDAKVGILVDGSLVFAWTADRSVPRELVDASHALAHEIAHELGGEVRDVAGGLEPAQFAAHFFGWHCRQSEVPAFVDPRLTRVKAMRAAEAAARRAFRDHVKAGKCVSVFPGSNGLAGVRVSFFSCVNCNVGSVCINCARGCHHGHHLSAGRPTILAGSPECGCGC
ncbi:severin [Thecamonas trahens ATCC 50062]|uniref:Severin n=1 Tax=Thecamonas trahens ATCC 50062 TaxID=461836 RepID=A0A0L0D5C0_THETB|nr:severin [Thecamonas trahens ATCC 50062]KNC47276.1 severin [Thecamonas trahens ATCC 50062]|eukprot:XP_013759619.1 severin [Thecamonas trahens ATCC 50062]